MDVGSSYLPGELVAAFLWAQLQEAASITDARLAIWARYNASLAPLEAAGLLRRPTIPAGCEHNAHMYYVVIAPQFDRQQVLTSLRAAGINAVFHYVPLHSGPAGRQFGRVHGAMDVTNAVSERLFRLPLWVGLSEAQQHEVVFQLGCALA